MPLRHRSTGRGIRHRPRPGSASQAALLLLGIPLALLEYEDHGDDYRGGYNNRRRNDHRHGVEPPVLLFVLVHRQHRTNKRAILAEERLYLGVAVLNRFKVKGEGDSIVVGTRVSL